MALTTFDNTLSNYQYNQLQNILSGSFDFKYRSLSNVKIVSNLYVTHNSDIILDQQRGIKWADTAIAFGVLSGKHAVTLYTNNLLRFSVDSDGIKTLYNYNLGTTDTGLVFGDVSIKLQGSTTTGKIIFNVNATERVRINNAGFLLDNTTILQFGTTGNNGVTFGATAPSTSTGIFGTAISVDGFIAGKEVFAFADPGTSTTNSSIYVLYNNVLTQVLFYNDGAGHRILYV